MSRHEEGRGMKAVHRILSALSGKNSAATPTNLITDQMKELRPLPLGRAEFEEWSDRLIAGAMIQADPISQKKALAEMIMHLKPMQSCCDDAYFIHCLRKGAANEVAFALMKEYQAEQHRRALATAVNPELKVE
jgi:hypothetical protein